ncbi:Hypothetical predicted protein [Paramuricea clavata]|uniref:Uncharacterized protein n=1 Tax=Paramuricea clavata TaxID=317549 RepID=A0A7D9DQK7_PARCT|nr:Hypothetical predicted protein [Paramuricea clavata]
MAVQWTFYWEQICQKPIVILKFRRVTLVNRLQRRTSLAGQSLVILKRIVHLAGIFAVETIDDITKDQDLKKLIFQDQLGIKPTRCCTCSEKEMRECAFIRPVRESTRVLANTVLDLFGPFEIKLGRKTIKEAWCCIFTCMSSRAIHLEPCTDRSTDTFLMAFRRFSCIRKYQKYLPEMVESWDIPKIKSNVSEFGTSFEWCWNVPKASHMNIVVASLIKSVRRALESSSKAFDTISHEILLEKLHIYGVDANSLSWFQSYLQDRKQKCYVNDVLSGERTINCGGPQGSILGPLLFLIYINDLPQCLKHSTARMYADDTNITTTRTSIREIVTHANDDLNNISDWLKANKLSLNVTKTEYMFIGSDQNLDKLRDVPLLFLENKAINRVKATKSLGVHIDEKLTWH